MGTAIISTSKGVMTGHEARQQGVGGEVVQSAALFAVVVFLIWVYIQMERNEVISHIVKSEPNRVNWNWNFLSSVFVSAIPLLGILAATSSDLSDLIHAWIDSTLRVTRFGSSFLSSGL